MSVAVSTADESPRVPPSGFAPTDDAVETPRGQSDVAAAFRERADGASAPVRVSCVVPLGTSAELGAMAEESVNGTAEPSDSASMRPSDVVPRSPSPHENRAAVRVSELGLTRQGPTFGSDEDDEATTVDATAGLSFEEREALGLRVHSSLEETRPHGTPLPEPVRTREEPGGAVEPAPPAVEAAAPTAEAVAPPAEAAEAVAPAEPAAPPVEAAAALEEPARGVDEAEVARQQRLMFKQTMLLGLPMRETPPPPPAPAGSEPAVMASAVRVVGPPTQPPPRRSRRVGPVSSATAGEPELPDHDHEAFVLTNPIASPDAPRKVVPDAAPPPSLSPPAAPTPPSVRRSRPGPPSLPLLSVSVSRASLPGVSVSRASLPGVMLPPAPAPRDYEIDSAPLHSKTMPPLRATIEPPGSLARTRPPGPHRGLEPELDELPLSDPFAGFVAPPPSLLQRWLVVIVVALAVVGLCSLTAIAFGFLGKTGW